MTIKDVAEYSGVSITTVSRVLNNHPDVREEVRAKVWTAIQELHYVPNSSARDMGKAQADTVGVVIRGVQNPFLNSVMRSVETAITKAGYMMVPHHIGTEEDELSAGAGLVRSKRLRGLIFLGGRFDYTPEEVAMLEVPFVCCTYTNSFGSLGKKNFSSVYIDDYAEAYRATKLLIEKGHKKIAVLLSATDDHSISELRYKGYCDALKDAKLELDPDLVVECGGYEMQDAYKATRRLSQRRDDFTALFTVADAMGIAAMKALFKEGRRVPEDCSIIAIDGIEMSKYTTPTLTTLIQPREQMGEEAVKILMELLSGEKNRHTCLETRLRKGETLVSNNR